MTDRISRVDTTLIGAERSQLEAFLADNREELIDTLTGLSDDQARQRLVPSLTTPLGLLKHAVFVEQVWFGVALAGLSRHELGLPDDIDASFTLDDDDTIETVVARFRAASEASDRIAAAHGLDDLARHNRRGPLTVRWVYLHMIEELARHTGHADILRELIMARRS